MKKWLISISIVIVLFLGVRYNTSDAVTKCFTVDTGGTLTNGLVSFYNLSDTTDFFSTNNLTNNNTVGFDTGLIGNAASGTTANTNKNLDIVSNLGIDGTTTTLSAWVRIGTQPSAQRDTIVRQKSGGIGKTDVTYELEYRDAAGAKTVNFKRNKYGIATDQVTTSTTLTTGTWYHLLETYDGVTLHAYLNSNSQGTTAASGNGSTATNSNFSILGFGSNDADDAGIQQTSGRVDMVGIWSRVLTQTEINDLYNSGTGSEMTTSCGGGTATAPQTIWSLIWLL